MSVYFMLFEWVRYARQVGIVSRLPTGFPKKCAGLAARDGRRAHQGRLLISSSYLFYAPETLFRG